MSFEYGEETDSSGNITHTGSWGAKSIPKDAMARIIENLRLVYDGTTPGIIAYVSNANFAPAGYGLGKYNNTALTNINTAVATGMYYFDTATLGTKPSTIEYGTVFVQAYSALYQTQFVISTALSLNSYMRTMHNGIWSAWETVAFTGDTVASANTLSTSRKINGIGFNGSTDVVVSDYITASSYGTTGYIKRYGGYTEQWGQIIIPASSSATITYTHALTTLCYAPPPTTTHTPSSVTTTVDITAISTTTMTIKNNASVSNTIFWKVFGVI